MKNETKNEMNRIAKKFKQDADFYEKILHLGGISDEQLLQLVSIYNLPDHTGIETPNMDSLDDFKKPQVEKFKEMCKKAMTYVINDRASRIDLFKKAIYLNELETDEVKKLIVGYYMSICSVVLTPYLFMK